MFWVRLSFSAAVAKKSWLWVDVEEDGAVADVSREAIGELELPVEPTLELLELPDEAAVDGLDDMLADDDAATDFDGAGFAAGICIFGAAAFL